MTTATKVVGKMPDGDTNEVFGKVGMMQCNKSPKMTELNRKKLFLNLRMAMTQPL